MTGLRELGYHPGNVALEFLPQRILRKYVAKVHRDLDRIQEVN